MMVNELLRQSVECQRPRPRYAYMAPYRHQAKSIAWDFLKLYTRDIPGVAYNEAELRCDLPWGARLTLFGADNPDALRGMYLDGAVLDEYAFMHPDVWERVISPTLVDRDGFAVFIGTPNGRNHFFELYQESKVDAERLTAFWPASITNVLTEEELARQRAIQAPEVYAQEYGCSFEAAIRGAYYAQQLEQAQMAGRVRAVAYEPQTPVETWWDLGWDDATAIIFTQTVGREIHVIDYLEANHEPLAYYAKELQRRPYVYREHHLPHDASKTELGSGKSLLEQLRPLGLLHLTSVRQVEVEEGIQAARSLFPRVWFDEVKARRLIDCLANYRQEWIQARQTFGTKPLHDQYSHGADAFRYLAVGTRDALTMQPDGPRYARSGLVDYRGERRAQGAARYAAGSLS
jgi:phage terminase large subunit